MTHNRSVIVALTVGLALTVTTVGVAFRNTDALAEHIHSGYPTYSTAQIDSAVTTYLILLASIGAVGTVGWVGTIIAVRAGLRWARPVATTVFVLGTTISLSALLVRDTSGDTGLPPLLGWVGMLPCLAGLAAVMLLWRNYPRGSTVRTRTT